MPALDITDLNSRLSAMRTSVVRLIAGLKPAWRFQLQVTNFGMVLSLFFFSFLSFRLLFFFYRFCWFVLTTIFIVLAFAHNFSVFFC